MKTVKFLFIFLAFACSNKTSKQLYKQSNRLNDCRKNWHYINTKSGDEITLRVILFDKRDYYDVATYPCFVIGVTPNNDTVGVVDKVFEDAVEVGKNVKATYDTWRDIDTLTFIPAFLISKDEKRNGLYCSVKTVYRAKINKN
jgi:hypothetical protein